MLKRKTFIILLMIFIQQIQAQVTGEYEVLMGPHWTETNYKAQPPNLSKGVMQIDHLQQCGQTYSNDQLGNCSDETICSAGCAMTSLTMVLRTNGLDINPNELNDWLVDNDGYTSDGCLLYWNIAVTYPNSTVTFYGSADYSLNIIRQEIDAGNPVIACVNNGNHFVVISGYSNSGTESSDFLVKDPGRADGDNRNWSNYVNGVTGLRLFHNVGYLWSYSISGYVLDEDYSGLSGVNIQFSNGAGIATTNSTGYYTYEVNTEWNGTATPSLNGFDFTPQNRTYNNLTENQTNQFYNSTKIPIADFSYSGVYGEFPRLVTFTDESIENPTSWQWNFGDGNISTEQNPTHSYTAPGTYSVSLTVSKGGTTNTKIVQVTLTDQLHASFKASTTSGAFPLAVNFTDQSAGSPTGWSWNFGDNGTSTDRNPSHTYSNKGNYKVKLTITKGAYNDATDGNFTIVVNDPVYYIKGRIMDGLNGVPGIQIEAINSIDGSITDNDVTDSQGYYELWVTYHWTGKVYAYGGTSYSDRWLDFGEPITSNQLNKNILLEPINLEIFVTQKPNLIFEFQVKGTPWGTLYEWDIDGTPFIYSTHLSKPELQLPCEIGGSGKIYYISLDVTVGEHIYTVNKSVTVNPCSFVNSALAFAETDCNVFGIWDKNSSTTKISKIDDLSYPYSDLARIAYNLDVGSSNWFYDGYFYWDSDENCPNGFLDCKAKEHYIFSKDCRVFDEVWYSKDSYGYFNMIYSAGHHMIELKAFDLNLVNHNAATLEFDVVNCLTTSYNNDLQDSYHYTANGKDVYFNGYYEISSLNNIPNYSNKNLEFNACNSITLKPGFKITASANNSTRFLINSCVQENKNKSYIESSIPYSDIYMEELVVVEESETSNKEGISTETSNVEIARSNIVLYPIPTSNVINIDLSNNYKHVKNIYITNIRGDLLFEINEINSEIISIDLSNKPTGIYIAKIVLKSKIEIYKILKI